MNLLSLYIYVKFISNKIKRQLYTLLSSRMHTLLTRTPRWPISMQLLTQLVSRY